MGKKKIISVGRFVKRNKPLRKIGIDTDNCFSWMKQEKETWDYKPRIAKRNNFLHANYIVFSELIHLLSKKNPNIELNKKKVFQFLKRNKIRPIKKKDVNQDKVNETLEILKQERAKSKWPSGDNDLKIISIYFVAGIDSISTNNKKDFEKPCDYLGIGIDLPSIIEPFSRQDVNRMLKDLSKHRY